MTHSKCLRFWKIVRLTHTLAHIWDAEGSFWFVSVQIGTKAAWRWHCTTLALVTSHLFFRKVWHIPENNVFKDVHIQHKNNFVKTVRCPRITQPLGTTCWFCTKHKCLALSSKPIRKFNPTGWDQHFLKLILHIQHRLNLAWGNLGGMTQNSLSQVPISVLAPRLGHLKPPRSK